MVSFESLETRLLLTSTPVFVGGAFAVGDSPSGVVCADFNRDGKLDLATANDLDATVSVLLGQGDGTFLAAAAFPVGNYPSTLVAADFNGDGKTDLAVLNSADNTVSVLLGNGDGTFAAKIDSLTGANPMSLAAGDFNGDGKMDLAVADLDDGTVSVLLGNGDGTFAPKVDYTVGNSPDWVIAADLNGDGKQDLVAANSTDNTVSVLLGQGNGTFGVQATFATGVSPDGIVAADFNGDGKLDLATANQGDNTVTVLLGTGTGSFGAKTAYATGQGPYAVVAGDFNGDGHLDLATANYAGDSVSILVGNGNGTFQPKIDAATGGNPMALVAADFNADGLLDLATADSWNNTATALMNKGLSPLVVNDAARVLKYSAAVTVPVLANDVTALGYTLTVTAVDTTGTKGLVTLIGGTVTYSPNGQFNSVAPNTLSSDSFKYTVSDGHGGSGVATVTIAIDGGTGPMLTVTDDSGSANDRAETLADTLVGQTSAAGTYTLTNPGDQPLTVTSFATAGANPADFVVTVLDDTGKAVAVTGGTFSVPAGKAYKVQVALKPTVAGARAATITFGTNDPANASVTLTAKGNGLVTPRLTVTDNCGDPNDRSVTLPDTAVGKVSAASIFTLSNTGNKTMTVTGFALKGTNPADFAVTVKSDTGAVVSVTSGTFSIPIGKAYTIEVKFQPKATGSRTALIHFTTNDTTNASVTLTLRSPVIYVTTFKDVVNPNDGVISLREAILQANSDKAGYELINLPAGTYTLTIPGRLENAGYTGDLDITNAFGSLTIQGSVIASTIINGMGIDRVLHTLPGTTVSLRNLTIMDGLAQDDGSTVGGSNALGGGILCDGLGIGLTNVQVINNQAVGAAGDPGLDGWAAFGGGIYLGAGTLTYKGGTISGNLAIGGAGGAGLAGSNDFGTTAQQGPGGDGGLGGNGGAAWGGGIALMASSQAISNLVVSRNQAIGGAGGLGGIGGVGDPPGAAGQGGIGGDAQGGGLYATTAVTLLRFGGTFLGNTIQGGAGGAGGDAVAATGQCGQTAGSDYATETGLSLDVLHADVWHDGNRDGLHQSGEGALAGAGVQLLSSTQALLVQAATDAYGEATFLMSKSGTYYLKYTPPSGYKLSPKGVGTNAALNSAADPTTGLTAKFSLTVPSADTYFNAGAYLPSETWSNPSPISYTVGDGAVLIDPWFTLTGVSGTVSSASVSITGNFASGQDVLGFTGTGLSAAFDPVGGILMLTGTGTVAQYQAALASVTFINDDETTSTLDRTVSYQVLVGTASVAQGTRLIHVATLNAAPTVSLPGPQSVYFNGLVKGNLVLSTDQGNVISVADADAGSSPIQVTLSGLNGTLTLAGTAGLVFTAGDGTSDGTMTFTGTVADINTALDGLTFAPNANYGGAAQVQLLVNDLGNTGGGGAQICGGVVDVFVDPFVISGSTLDVYGTGGADTFSYTVSDGPTWADVSAVVTVQLNQYTRTYAYTQGFPSPGNYEQDGWAPRTVVLHGMGGSDTATAGGGSTAPAAACTLFSTTGTAAFNILDGTFNVSFQGISTKAVTGSSTANAYVYDTAGNDTFTATPAVSTMIGTGLSSTLYTFARVYAYSTGGTDTAKVFDSPSADIMDLKPGLIDIYGTGYSAIATGFAKENGYSTAGGADYVKMYDTAGNDTFTGMATSAALSGPGVYESESGFKTVYVYSTAGTDTIKLYDSPGNDSMYLKPRFAEALGPSYDKIIATGFAQESAYSKAGGSGSASLYDTPGNDVFTVTPTLATMVGPGLTETATDFKTVAGYSTGGSDVANLYDSPGDDVLHLKPGSADISCSATGTLDIATGFAVENGYSTAGGADIVKFYDTAGNDVFTASPTSATMTGTGLNATATGFHSLYAYSTAGTDTANVYASAGDDLVRLQLASLTDSATGYLVTATGFVNENAYSTAGGNCTAQFYDSAGNATFTASPTSATMAGTGLNASAAGFHNLYGYSTSGTDTAKIYDSAADDLLVVHLASMSVTGTGYSVSTIGFVNEYAYATAGGTDTAKFYDTSNDTFTGHANSATMVGPGLNAYESGYEQVYAYSSGGTDVANLYDSAGDDTMHLKPAYADVTGTTYDKIIATGFAQENAYSTLGGNDVVKFYDTPGNDLFTATPTLATLVGTGLNASASGFKQVFAYSSGGVDTAKLYDSAGNDTFYVCPTGSASMVGPGYSNWTSGFTNVYGYATAGGTDTATLVGTTSVDTLLAQTNWASFTGGGYYSYASGFGQVTAIGSLGDLKTITPPLAYTLTTNGF